MIENTIYKEFIDKISELSDGIYPIITDLDNDLSYVPDRCFVLWTDVQIQQKNHTDMYCRGAWHRHTRRSGSVSSCKIRDAYSAGRHVYIHSAIPYLYSGRKHSGSNCHADFKEKWSTDSI